MVADCSQGFPFPHKKKEGEREAFKQLCIPSSGNSPPPRIITAATVWTRDTQKVHMPSRIGVCLTKAEFVDQDVNHVRAAVGCGGGQQQIVPHPNGPDR